MREKNYFGRWKILCPTSFPANALANYLEEGDLKLMHTLHNQEIQRISPRNPKIYHREIQKCSLSWGGGFKLMHTLHNHESKEFHKEIKKTSQRNPNMFTILRRGVWNSQIHSIISSILIRVRLKKISPEIKI